MRLLTRHLSLVTALVACATCAIAQQGGSLTPPTAGSGDALTTNPLSQFAATTSSQFKGVISDENAPDGASSKVIMALGSLSIASGKTFTASNTMTFAGTDAQTYTFPSTSATIARTDAANTFTGVQTFPATIVVNTDSTAIPADTGGWTYFVANAFATSGTSLQDITGMVTGALTNAATYEFECRMRVTESADVNGTAIALHAGGSGSPVVNAAIRGTTTTTAVTQTGFIAFDSATSALVTTSAGTGIIETSGTFVTGTSTTFSIRAQHATAGTSTITGTLKVRRIL